MNIELILEVYNESLSGTYNPEKLEAAYRELVNHEQPVPVRMKKNQIYAWVNNVYPTLENSEETHRTEKNDPNTGRTTHNELEVNWLDAKKVQEKVFEDSIPPVDTHIVTPAPVEVEDIITPEEVLVVDIITSEEVVMEKPTNTNKKIIKRRAKRTPIKPKE